MNDAKRLDLVVKGLAAAVACSILVTMRLWLAFRSFPLVPVFAFLPTIPFPWDLFMVSVMLLALAAAFFMKRPTAAILVFLAYFAIEVAEDQNRLQTWFYQFALMFAAAAILAKRTRGAAGQRAALDACRLIVAGTYFWGGLQKINAGFFAQVIPWLMQPLAPVLGSATGPVGIAFGVLLPAVEIAAGVGLLTRRFRRHAIIAASGISVSILLYFSPLGRYWNTAIWPWNIALIFFTAVLFSGERSSIVAPWKKGAALGYRVIAVLFWVMPVFSLFGLYDAFLSVAVYTGNTRYAAIEMPEDTKKALPPFVQELVTKDDQGTNRLSLFIWAVAELNVSPYPEKRVYEGVLRTFCDRYGNATLVTYERPALLTGRQMITRRDCGGG